MHTHTIQCIFNFQLGRFGQKKRQKFELLILHKNKSSDSSMEVKLPALLEIMTTDRPPIHKGRVIFTSNNIMFCQVTNIGLDCGGPLARCSSASVPVSRYSATCPTASTTTTTTITEITTTAIHPMRQRLKFTSVQVSYDSYDILSLLLRLFNFNW